MNKINHLKVFIFHLFLSLNFYSFGKNIAVIGTGYVGLVVGTCLSELGNNVICADIDQKKIELLQKFYTQNNCELPFFENKLKDLVVKGVKNKCLKFSSDIKKSILDSEVIYLAVGTPSDENGNTDLSYIYSAVKMISENLNSDKIVVVKSTVPVGTNRTIENLLNKSSNPNKCHIVSNPEFLKEGSAVDDFFKPKRIILGVESKEAKEIMSDIYSSFKKRGVPFIFTNFETAEIIKYASNAFLATKVAFINEIARFCEKTNGKIQIISRALGLDDRIGNKFLSPGPGFGGSCFPKDLMSLVSTSKLLKNELPVIQATFDSNEIQKTRIFEKFSNLVDFEFKDKVFTILGLSFKANTDDVRNSSSISIINQLKNVGAKIRVYDPMAMENMKKIFPNLDYCDSIEQAVKNSDGIVVMTEWNEFKNMDLESISKLVRKKNILDCRNILNTDNLKRLGFKFENIGNAEVN